MRTRLLLRTAVLIGAFFLINDIFTTAYTKFTRQPYLYEASREAFESNMADISFLVLGDSHPLYALDASKIRGGYNFAIESESYIFSYYKLRYYLKNEDFHPDVIVLPVSFHSFSGYRNKNWKSTDQVFWGRYLDYYELGKYDNRLNSIKDRLRSEIAYLGGFEETIERIYSDKDTWKSNGMVSGYKPVYSRFSDNSLADMQLKAGERAATHFEDVAYIDPMEVEYFNRTIDLLEESDIQYVFVCFPVTELYSQEANRYFPVDEHLAQVQDLLQDRSGYVILDYHDLFFGHPEYFNDADHLNVVGAMHLTDQLVDDLEKDGISWSVPVN